MMFQATEIAQRYQRDSLDWLARQLRNE